MRQGGADLHARASAFGGDLACAHAPVFAAVVLAIAVLLFAPKIARGQTPDELFGRGSTALAKGEYAAAIDAFEALSDRGVVHPDASYNRGLAYAMRARARADRPGDLGRAAAALEEALRLRPDDAEARSLLDSVRAEITRRHARGRLEPLDARPPPLRALVRLVSERTWTSLALASSFLLAAGLVLRRHKSRIAHVTGSVLAPTSALALLAFTPLAYAAYELRTTMRDAVVIVPELHFENEGGTAKGGKAIVEGSLVEVGERKGGRVFVQFGSREGYAPITGVRLLPP